MQNLGIILTALFTGVAAYATFKTMLQTLWPTVISQRTIWTGSPQGITITRLYAPRGTFSEIIRDQEGRGHAVDSGQSEIILNRFIYAGEKYTFAPQYLYIDGKQLPYKVNLKLDFFRTWSFHKFKAKAIPLTEA